eukprot:gene5083-7090_t
MLVPMEINDSVIDSSCFNCKNFKLIVDFSAGDVVCQECGEVQNSRVIDYREEIRSYDEESSTSRTSGIDSKSLGYSLTSFSTKFSDLKQSLERAQCTQSDRKELLIIGNLRSINELCSKLYLSKQIEVGVTIFNSAQHLMLKATVIFEDSSSNAYGQCMDDYYGFWFTCRFVVMLTAKPNLMNLALPSLPVNFEHAVLRSWSCRMAGYPRTIEEISRNTGVSSNVLNRFQSTICRNLHLQIGRIYPSSLVARIISDINIEYCIVNDIITCCDTIVKLDLLETVPPQVVATGVIVVMCLLSGLGVDLNRISSTSFVTVSNIRSIYSAVHQYLRVIIPTTRNYKIKVEEVLQFLPKSLDRYATFVDPIPEIKNVMISKNNIIKLAKQPINIDNPKREYNMVDNNNDDASQVEQGDADLINLMNDVCDAPKKRLKKKKNENNVNESSIIA